GEGVELIDHGVHGFFELKNLAAHVDGDFLGQVAVGDGDGDIGDATDLGGQIAGHEVDVIGQDRKDAAHVAHLGLTAERAFGADLAGDASDFGGEAVQLIDHRIDRFFELEDFAAHVDGDFFRQIAVGDRDGHIGDAAHLGGQITGHEIDVIG